MDGAVSATFKSLSIPVEVGAAGRAYTTGAPYWMADYFVDDSISRTPGTDAAVAEEGIVAKLAAPLRFGAQVMGALVVAQRRRRTFTPSDIATVSAFATHAALAISKARLVTELSQSVRQLGEVNAQLLTERHQIKRALAFHEELNRATLLDGGGIPEIVKMLGQTTGLEVAYLDPNDAPLASYPESGRPPWLAHLADDGKSPSQLLPALRETGSASVTGDDGTSVTLVLVASHDEHLGVIAVASRGPLGESDLLLAERAALLAAVTLSAQRAAREAETRRRLETLGELLGADRDDDALAGAPG